LQQQADTGHGSQEVGQAKETRQEELTDEQ